MKPKYYFTQISAPIVGVGVVLVLLALIGKFHIIDTKDINHLDVMIISIVFLTIPVSMVIWGKFLAFLGILSWDEAKGYPWSKPWKENKKINNA